VLLNVTAAGVVAALFCVIGVFAVGASGLLAAVVVGPPSVRNRRDETHATASVFGVRHLAHDRTDRGAVTTPTHRLAPFHRACTSMASWPPTCSTALLTTSLISNTAFWHHSHGETCRP
jgi:hypothetical protein